MEADEEGLNEQISWNKSFLDREFTRSQISQSDLEAIAIAIGSIIKAQREGILPQDGLISLGGLTLGESERKYQLALSYYNIRKDYSR